MSATCGSGALDKPEAELRLFRWLEPGIVLGFLVVLAGLLTGRSLRTTQADLVSGTDASVWTEGIGRVAGSLAGWLLAAGAIALSAWLRRLGESGRSVNAAFAAAAVVTVIAAASILRLLSQQGEIDGAPYRLEIAAGVYVVAFITPVLAALCAAYAVAARRTTAG